MDPNDPRNRDYLINEARDRGRRLGEYKAKSHTYIWRRFPAMSDAVTYREIHERVADILPLNEQGQATVLACYEACRDEFNKHYEAQKARQKAVPDWKKAQASNDQVPEDQDPET